MSSNGRMLKMSELAERSGVSAGTIKHYLREGLLGDQSEVLRTSRNMAYYPERFVERVRLIKRLQEERFMPLRERGAGSHARAYAPHTSFRGTCSTGSSSLGS